MKAQLIVSATRLLRKEGNGINVFQNTLAGKYRNLWPESVITKVKDWMNSFQGSKTSQACRSQLNDNFQMFFKWNKACSWLNPHLGPGRNRTQATLVGGAITPSLSAPPRPPRLSRNQVFSCQFSVSISTGHSRTRRRFHTSFEVLFYVFHDLFMKQPERAREDYRDLYLVIINSRGLRSFK